MSNHPANHVPNPAVGTPQAGTAGRRRVVVVPVLPQQNPLTLFAALVAAVLTLVAHLVIIFLLFNLNVGDADAGVGEVNQSPTVVDDETKVQEKDLTNEETGFDSSEKTDFNVDRIEEVSVPGLVTPTESVGLANAPETPARTLPAPPGTGGGQGAGIIDPTQIGTASSFGDIGGKNGIATLGGFAGRSASTREKMLKEGGGNDLSEAAVAKGLLWLARHQSTDGRWSLNQFNQHAHEEPSPFGKPITCNCGNMSSKTDGDLAATAFALLPFLAAGITHRPATAEQRRDYQKTVSKGLDFIISKQARDGNYGGGMYSHGLVTIAMCEAYGMTADPKLKMSAQRAINYIVAAQDPTGGGWRLRTAPGWRYLGCGLAIDGDQVRSDGWSECSDGNAPQGRAVPRHRGNEAKRNLWLCCGGDGTPPGHDGSRLALPDVPRSQPAQQGFDRRRAIPQVAAAPCSGQQPLLSLLCHPGDASFRRR